MKLYYFTEEDVKSGYIINIVNVKKEARVAADKKSIVCTRYTGAYVFHDNIDSINGRFVQLDNSSEFNNGSICIKSQGVTYQVTANDLLLFPLKRDIGFKFANKILHISYNPEYCIEAFKKAKALLLTDSMNIIGSTVKIIGTSV